MALAAETPRVLHAGNDTVGPFSLSYGGTPITYADSAHIRVWLITALGMFLQTEGVDYNLSASSVLPPVGQETQTVSAATLTLTDALASGSYLLIERLSPSTQEVILTTSGGFNSAANERGYDAVTRRIQELQVRVDRSIVLNELDTSDGPIRLDDTIDDLDGKILGIADGGVTGYEQADFIGEQGPQGNDGADGSLWFAAAGAPGGGTGSNGDMYLNVTTGDVYGPKTGGSWGSSVGSIRGPNGPGTGDMLKSDNLSGLASASTARSNLGLGSAALLASSAVFQVANNLSEGVASTMRANLGLGSAALLASSAVLQTANNLSDLANASTARANLGLGSAALLPETTAAQFRAGTSGKVLTTDKVWAAAEAVALTDAATITINLNTFINATVLLGGNRTLGQPTNAKFGQCGYIYIAQDGTGSRTLAFHSDWKFANGSDPVLSTAPNAIDLLFYQYIAPNFVFASLIKAVA